MSNTAVKAMFAEFEERSRATLREHIEESRAELRDHVEQSESTRTRLETDLFGLLSRHSEDDVKAFVEVNQSLDTLKADVTKIRRTGDWVRGAVWALVGVLTAGGVGIFAVGKYAAEKWIGEISDKAVERAIWVDKWKRGEAKGLP